MMMPMPSRGELADHGVDLGLGADVDAARRLVEDEHAWAGCSSHLLSITFCWLPPESLATGEVDRRRADREPLAEGFGGGALRRRCG